MGKFSNIDSSSSSYFFFLYRGVEGHTSGDLPWAWFDELFCEDMGKIVGKAHVVQISLYRDVTPFGF